MYWKLPIRGSHLLHLRAHAIYGLNASHVENAESCDGYIGTSNNIIVIGNPLQYHLGLGWRMFQSFSPVSSASSGQGVVAIHNLDAHTRI